MHTAQIRQEIIDRVLDRRGRLHLFDRFEPNETALVVIDMQPTFVAPGSPAEVPASRGIVANIQRLADVLRPRGALICWVTHANSQTAGCSDWNGFFDYFVADDVRAKTLASLKPGSPDTLLWHELTPGPGDVSLFKNRYSALIQGSSDLKETHDESGIRNLLVTGTKTNVCCEATARDAMMLDYNTVMISDGTAALSEEEHRATLETFIQQFGDVLTADEAIELVRSCP
mgnify:FL=1